MKTSKKILLLGLILLIVAGVVVIALKGLNVSLLFRQHETINLYIGKEIDYKEFSDMCKEIFGNKKVEIRKVELFSDSISINVDTFTDEEKENLVKKLNEKYVAEGETEYTVDNIKVITIPNIRLRDVVSPYIKPVLISGALIIIYMLIRFRKNEPLKILGKLVLELVLTEIAILSLIAITRIPVYSLTISMMFIIAVIELTIFNYRLEKNN